MVDRSVKEAYYNDRMKQAVYQKYKQEAETSKTLFENMWKVISCGVNKSQYDSAPQETKNEVRTVLKNKEPKVPGDLESWAVPESKIDEICDKYIDEFITPMKQISEQLESAIDILGQKNLMINNLSFDKRIKEMQDILNKEIERMQAFVDAVSERAYLVHMIQYYHLVDYYRYYGNYNNFGNNKTWDRNSEGID